MRNNFSLSFRERGQEGVGNKKEKSDSSQVLPRRSWESSKSVEGGVLSSPTERFSLSQGWIHLLTADPLDEEEEVGEDREQFFATEPEGRRDGEERRRGRGRPSPPPSPSFPNQLEMVDGARSVFAVLTPS